jgi:dTDP-4-amino-4,6-dideoxygalactose transaminase
MKDKPIFVTQPDLPPLEEFIPYLEQIWENKILTNGGPFHVEFEERLAAHLGIEHISLFSNGTIALITALKALRITGEVITTPYSFVATAHSLLWNGIKPVFVDIDPETFNINPQKIESAITPQTTAILPVHCYGNPCQVDEIQKIADTFNLRVIYDAAHAFGIHNLSGSLLRYGDLSILSFHATKTFHTFEGGAIISPDAKTKLSIDHLKNFGFVDETTVVAAGINGKMNEISAAFGLLQLKHFAKSIGARETIDARYRSKLMSIEGVKLLQKPEHWSSNYSYFPIRIEDSYPLSRDRLYDLLRENGIYARRYFYPLISEFSMYRELPSSREMKIALDVANRVLCLPIYPALAQESQELVISIIESPVSHKPVRGTP